MSRITANAIVNAIGSPHVTFFKVGLHHYAFEYTNAALGIYMQRKDIHPRTLSQFSLEKWAEIGKAFVATLEN